MSPISTNRCNALIAIGASTGGTEAILEILKTLPGNMPGIVITQHMPKGFTDMYAKRLDSLCNLTVKEAKDGDLILPGHVLIAPGSKQMEIIKKGQHYQVHCYEGTKVNGHSPSVDVLFSSIADVVEVPTVGIILTGMGCDGAKGLLKMRQHGAYTIGQSKESCVVYGMPMVAKQLGAVTIQAPCNQIAHVLLHHLNKL